MHGHSAPGRLLAVAERLIRRAEQVLENARSVPEAITGAMLALEAQECLGNRTPTTSLEALSLKHRLEVRAECMFSGVDYNIDVKSRFREVERDVRSIGRWLRPNTRTLATLSSEVSIVSSVLLTFREFNQFDEEQECQNRIRHLNRHIWFCRNRVWAWVFYPVRWYFDCLLGSVPVFGAAIILWLGVFTFLFAQMSGMSETHGGSHPFLDAMTSFVGMQPAHDDPKAILFAYFSVASLNALAIGLGFVHLGVFVSHLYSIISRR